MYTSYRREQTFRGGHQQRGEAWMRLLFFLSSSHRATPVCRFHTHYASCLQRADARRPEVSIWMSPSEDAKGSDFPMIVPRPTSSPPVCGLSNQDGICPFSLACERGAVKLSPKFSCVQTGGYSSPARRRIGSPGSFSPSYSSVQLEPTVNKCCGRQPRLCTALRERIQAPFSGHTKKLFNIDQPRCQLLNLWGLEPLDLLREILSQSTFDINTESFCKSNNLLVPFQNVWDFLRYSALCFGIGNLYIYICFLKCATSQYLAMFLIILHKNQQPQIQIYIWGGGWLIMQLWKIEWNSILTLTV